MAALRLSHLRLGKLQEPPLVQWSEFLATDSKVHVRFQVLPDFLKITGLEQGPLSLVGNSEKLLDRKK
jgi:hypothetical protein